MRVVLTVDVPKIGKAGEEITVKDGFARNFLIPQKLAVIAGSEEAKKIITIGKEKAATSKKDKADAASLIKSYEGRHLVFPVKVNAQGHPYQTITGKDIAKNLNIDPKLVKTKPFKSLGIFKAQVGTNKIVSNIIVEIKAQK